MATKCVHNSQLNRFVFSNAYLSGGSQLNRVFVDRVPYLCLAKTFEAIEKVSARSVDDQISHQMTHTGMCVPCGSTIYRLVAPGLEKAGSA